MRAFSLAMSLGLALHGAPVRAEVTQPSPCAVPLRPNEAAASESAATVPVAEAAWALALERWRGGGCLPPNYRAAASAMKAAALAGHPCASGAWGLMMARGWGAPRDTLAALAHLKESTYRGCPRAPYWAWLVLRDSARPATLLAAREQLTQAAALGDGHALNMLGALHEIDGLHDDARQLYQRAAAFGNLTATQNLARLQRHFSRGRERPELGELVHHADLGDAQASYLLARRLHAGDGVAINAAEALQRYRRAAQLGHAAAREMLDLIHARIGPSGRWQATAMAELAHLELRSDDINKTRGLTQPLEDEDPWAGL